VTALKLIPRKEFERAGDDLGLLADMCRANALVAVKRAGSGHLGSSFSSLDIVTHLLWGELNVAELGWDDPNRDIFFSSKGHDVPGLYAALHALGEIPTERLLRLRRLGGLDGHPDIGVPGIEANSGSLGMGLSKGRGMAWAKRYLDRGGIVVVMTGDGELQEGQNWEALASAAHQRVGNLWAIVDRNELQSDRPTEEILALGDLEAKLRAFGSHVEVCDGHDHDALASAFASMRAAPGDVPKVLVANTIKGRGVSFMEHPRALREDGGTYRWHAGAPDDDAFARAHDELVDRIAQRLPDLQLEEVPPLEDRVSLEGEPESGVGTRVAVSDEYVAAAYGEELLQLVMRHPEVVVLDADLASDCRVRTVELEQPSHFVEVGIAEQDMVSMAAGLARQGLLPVVNSFASFLASRANEQIYNQASEGTKVVYALHYAGLIPAGPGKSHQSVRDISLLGALPNVTIVQPVNADETGALLRWAIEDAEESVAIRLAIGPSPRRIELEGGLQPGRGSVVRDGDGPTLLAYGPVLVHEALVAAEALAARGVDLRVVAMPWLNRFDAEWLEELGEEEDVFVLEDHAPVGGLADGLRRALDSRTRVTAFGVEGWPACGTPPEALHAHELDGLSLAARIERATSLAPSP
jgi:transketolase